MHRCKYPYGWLPHRVKHILCVDKFTLSLEIKRIYKCLQFLLFAEL